MSEEIKNVDPLLVVNLLNEILVADPDAIKNLVEYRATANESLVNHKTVQCLCDLDSQNKPVNPKVGLLGVINGIVGIREDGMGHVAAEYDEDGVLQRFVVVTDKDQ